MYPYKIKAPIRVDHSKVHDLFHKIRGKSISDKWATRDALDYYLQEEFEDEYAVVIDTDSSLVIERRF